MSRKDESNNRANQRNPNNEAYWTSRGYDERPDGWQHRDVNKDDRRDQSRNNSATRK